MDHFYCAFWYSLEVYRSYFTEECESSLQRHEGDQTMTEWVLGFFLQKDD